MNPSLKLTNENSAIRQVSPRRRRRARSPLSIQAAPVAVMPAATASRALLVDPGILATIASECPEITERERER